jgi:hypothetical protein
MNAFSRAIVAFTVIFLMNSAAKALDTAKIEQLTGAKGKMDEKEGVFKVSLPRNDINVTAAGVKRTTRWSWAIRCCWKIRSIR